MMLVMFALVFVAFDFLHMRFVAEKDIENEEAITWNKDLTSRGQLGEADGTTFRVRQIAEHEM